MQPARTPGLRARGAMPPPAMPRKLCTAAGLGTARPLPAKARLCRPRELGPLLLQGRDPEETPLPSSPRSRSRRLLTGNASGSRPSGPACHCPPRAPLPSPSPALSTALPSAPRCPICCSAPRPTPDLQRATRRPPAALAVAAPRSGLPPLTPRRRELASGCRSRSLPPPGSGSRRRGQRLGPSRSLARSSCEPRGA